MKVFIVFTLCLAAALSTPVEENQAADVPFSVIDLEAEASAPVQNIAADLTRAKRQWGGL